jgi:hypothetical protein
VSADDRRSALVVLVPEAERAVSDLRLELDPHARLGVPAHVTVLYPFVPARDVDAALVAELGVLFGTVAAFDVTLTRTGWFGDDVLWLAPEPGDRFRELTERATSAFPDRVPYDGRFDDAAPHLTIGHQSTPARLRAAEATVTPRLPVPARAGDVTLLVEGADARWTVAATFPLAADVVQDLPRHA